MDEKAVLNLTDIALRAMAEKRGPERGWPRLCDGRPGLPRVRVLAKLRRDEREMVIAYHRVKLNMELADLDTGHYSGHGYGGYSVSERRKSAKGRLKHLEHVAQAFCDIDRYYGLIPLDPMKQAA